MLSHDAREVLSSSCAKWTDIVGVVKGLVVHPVYRTVRRYSQQCRECKWKGNVASWVDGGRKGGTEGLMVMYSH